MSKVAIITVAGTSSRFSKSLGLDSDDVQKCIYYEDNKYNTTLYRLALPLLLCGYHINIVTGHKSQDVENYVNDVLHEYMNVISFTFNSEYKILGSGKSMYLGILSVLNVIENPKEIMFIEGDLFVGPVMYSSIINDENSVISVNSNVIWAKDSVAVYFTEKNKPHFVYDTKHESFRITEPFNSIHNSAQIWKFTDIDLLKKSINNVKEELTMGTNLVLVGEYFRNISKFSVHKFIYWKNCNTVTDYKDK